MVHWPPLGLIERPQIDGWRGHLKKQVTSYFLEKNITAITKVITDVWRKGWARSIGALGLWLGDPLAGSASLRSPLDPSGLSDWLWWRDFTPLGVLIPRCSKKDKTASTWRGACPSAAWMTSGHPGCDPATHKQCPEHDGRLGCRCARFGSAAASSDRFKVLQDNIGTDKSFS